MDYLPGLADNTITIYSMPGCSACENAKELAMTLTETGRVSGWISTPVSSIDITTVRTTIGKTLHLLTTVKGVVWETWPIIFIGTKFIGGYTDLKAHFNQIDNGILPRPWIPTKRKIFAGTPWNNYVGMIYLKAKHPNACVVIPRKHLKTRKNFIEHEELSLRWNETLETITVPKDFFKYFDKCRPECGMKDKTPSCKGTTRFIVFPFGFTCKSGGHANYYLYDRINKSLERFEPNGKLIDSCISTKVDYDIPKLLNDHYQEPFIKTYLKPLDFLPEYAFQQIQEKEPLHKGSTNGYCAAWSLWYIDMRLSHPQIPPKTLVDMAIAELNNNEGTSPTKDIKLSEKNKECHSPVDKSLFTRSIRDYSGILIKCNKALKQADSHADPVAIVKKIIQNTR
jgi:glutaredoxin